MEYFLLPRPLVDVMRKALVLVLAVLILGVVPATAVIGFCAKMPCCFADPQDSQGLAFSAPMADCCDSITCAETQPQELGLSSAVKMVAKVLSATPELAMVVAAMPGLQVAGYIDTSPPPPSQHQRLSTLSAFLI